MHRALSNTSLVGYLIGVFSQKNDIERKRLTPFFGFIPVEETVGIAVRINHQRQYSIVNRDLRGSKRDKPSEFMRYCHANAVTTSHYTVNHRLLSSNLLE